MSLVRISRLFISGCHRATSIKPVPASILQLRHFSSPSQDQPYPALQSDLSKALSEVECCEHLETLSKLGVSKEDDLRLLDEHDLVRENVPLVHARRILQISRDAAALGPGEDLRQPSMAQQAMITLNNVGLTRGERRVDTILLSSFLGGCFLSFGASMFLLIGGGSPLFQQSLPGLHSVTAALIFPIGLSSIVLSGADLLTSNMLYGALPFASGDKRRTVEEKSVNLGRLWALSFAGNFAGCFTMALCTSAIFCQAPFASFVTGIALKKTSVAFIPAVVKLLALTGWSA